MKKLLAATMIALSMGAYAFGTLSYETTDGMRKICYYNTPQGTVAITIASYKVCPVTIR